MVRKPQNDSQSKKENMIENFASLDSKQKSAIRNLLITCLILIIVSFSAAYYTLPQPRESVFEFLGFTGKSATVSGFLVGLVSSVIFGMIDNGGLYFGMSALDPILPGDELEKAGWGNTFSDFLGGFLGTFIGILVKNLTKIEDTPLYSEVIGIVIGCIFGIYIPKMIKQRLS